jgi:uncharacterized repeat protein (TIGR01451 family)
MTLRRRPRRPAVLRVVLRVPGCLALVSGLLLCGTGASSAAAAPGVPQAPRLLPLPPAGVAARSSGAVMAARVTPSDAVVSQEENGDFTLALTNTGAVAASNVRVLLDDALEGNTVGSPDGRCLNRLDGSSPADLWCELGDVAPGQTVSVNVHTYMNSCVAFDPAASATQLPPPAFHWRIAYSDGQRVLSMNGPTPRWSCSPAVESPAP